MIRRIAHWRLAFGLAGGLLATCLVCQGRVYWRWGAVSDSQRALEACGGQKAYEADIRINAGRGHVTVFGFDRPLSAVVQALTRVFPTARFAPGGNATASATVTADGRVLRLLAFQLGVPAQTVVVDLEQSEADARDSRARPAVNLLADLPTYPGSEPVFFAEDEQARMSLAVARVAADPAAVAGFYRAALVAQGWSPALPAAGRGDARLGLNVYARHEETCCVAVEPALASDLTRITVLLKRQGIE